MAMSQRYVSDELTHFVGRGMPDQESQYARLIEIVKTGLLKSPGPAGSDITREEGLQGPRIKETHTLAVDLGRALSSNEKYSLSVVCFADIPIEDISIHMMKYSQFGLSFRKRFLVGRGASPVFYVVGHSTTRVRNPLANDPTNFSALQREAAFRRNGGHWMNFTRAELFDTADRQLQVDGLLITGSAPPRLSGMTERRSAGDEITRSFLAWYMFPYFKFFDSDLAEDHPDNYYMEREWRVVGAISFAVHDVERIIIPRGFAQRVRTDLPSYFGQISFTDPD
jgi:hypothetical protein